MPFEIYENRVEYVEDGAVLGVVDFPALDGETVDICHTHVDPSLRGRGIAGRMMEKVVECLRQSGRKAYPTCAYAVRWFDDHPECDDVLSEDAP